MHNRLTENQPTAGLSSLNKYENEYENGMGKSETELNYHRYCNLEEEKQYLFLSLKAEGNLNFLRIIYNYFQ